MRFGLIGRDCFFGGRNAGVYVTFALTWRRITLLVIGGINRRLRAEPLGDFLQQRAADMH